MNRGYIIGILAIVLLYAQAAWSGTNIQIYYDFGSVGTACANQRTNRVTTTAEFFYPDRWGSTFAFIDIDYAIHIDDPNSTPFVAYGEIARCLNFWQQTVLKDLSFQVEYNGGLGIGKGTGGALYGYGIHHAALVGLNYCLHTDDFRNIFNLELLYKYITDDYNGVRNNVPLQFTFVWNCTDFCTVQGLQFTGFLDLWGQKLSVPDRKTGTCTDPDVQSFVFITEPQIWYNIGQWFKCPNLYIGTEIEFSYNFTGSGFMVNPCVGIKWCFDS